MKSDGISIPIVDLFAGPGGLGEGFSAYRDDSGIRFKVKLSIEKDEVAHRTLQLRSFYRQFDQGNIPSEYYCYLAGEISREELFARYSKQARAAELEAWKAELGKTLPAQVDAKIAEALDGMTNWVLLGGPPCQAYSLVGRSRMKNVDPEKFEKDERHFLYREYLRVIAVHRPAIFLMENVKGILSSKFKGKRIFRQILNDLERPLKALKNRANNSNSGDELYYRLYAISDNASLLWAEYDPSSFVVRSENYGIPQTRHRVFILGVRSDLKPEISYLKPFERNVNSAEVLSDLPKIRSRLSKEEDSSESWIRVLKSISLRKWLSDGSVNPELKKEIISVLKKTSKSNFQNESSWKSETKCRYMSEWFHDRCLTTICNHESRSHMRSDIERYLFASVFAKFYGTSPKLSEFPNDLLPNHRNVRKKKLKETIFSDRFRVQVANRPSTTVTSHISKDGHYYIHYDPIQCRSLTVREAARLQTFPDNYFFEGSRTEQYHQVGNAVPPYLAFQIAEVLARMMNSIYEKKEYSMVSETVTELV